MRWCEASWKRSLISHGRHDVLSLVVFLYVIWHWKSSTGGRPFSRFWCVSIMRMSCPTMATSTLPRHVNALLQFETAMWSFYSFPLQASNPHLMHLLFITMLPSWQTAFLPLLHAILNILHFWLEVAFGLSSIFSRFVKCPSTWGLSWVQWCLLLFEWVVVERAYFTH